VTDNMFLAHIFRQRMRGSREEAKIRFFNLDGSPVDFSESGSQGGSAEEKFIYYGGSSIPIANNPGADIETAGTFGDNWLEYVKGFDVNPGDSTIMAPEGAYFSQMALHFMAEQSIEPGWMTVSVNMAYEDSGNPVISDLITIEVHYDQDTTGIGDFSFTDVPVNKNLVSIIPTDAELSLLVVQHGIEQSMTINVNLTLVHL
jgi:hypothetical protein